MDSRSLSLRLLISLGLIAVLVSVHSEASLVKRAIKKEIPNGDDDDEKFILPDGEPRDCIDKKESQTCEDDCGEHSECKRTSNDMECENECFGMCKYLQISQGKNKCVTNLVGFLSVYRNGEPRSFGHGTGHRIDDGDKDNDDSVDDEPKEEKKKMVVTSAPADSPPGSFAGIGGQKAPNQKDKKGIPFGLNFPVFSPDFGAK